MTPAEYRAKRQAAELTAEITLPSGAVFRLRRPPLDLWIAAGKIPQSFLRAMLEAGNGATSAQVRYSTEETLDGYSFLVEAITYSAVEPPISIDGAGETLALTDLDPEDFRFLIQWVQSGSPGVPVKTSNGGEVETDRLTRFRQKRPGGAADAGADGGEVRGETLSTVRAG